MTFASGSTRRSDSSVTQSLVSFALAHRDLQSLNPPLHWTAAAERLPWFNGRWRGRGQ
jgi:hypothetical protein